MFKRLSSSNLPKGIEPTEGEEELKLIELILSCLLNYKQSLDSIIKAEKGLSKSLKSLSKISSSKVIIESLIESSNYFDQKQENHLIFYGNLKSLVSDITRTSDSFFKTITKEQKTHHSNLDALNHQIGKLDFSNSQSSSSSSSNINPQAFLLNSQIQHLRLNHSQSIQIKLEKFSKLICTTFSELSLNEWKSCIKDIKTSGNLIGKLVEKSSWCQVNVTPELLNLEIEKNQENDDDNQIPSPSRPIALRSAPSQLELPLSSPRIDRSNQTSPIPSRSIESSRSNQTSPLPQQRFNERLQAPSLNRDRNTFGGRISPGSSNNEPRSNSRASSIDINSVSPSSTRNEERFNEDSNYEREEIPRNEFNPSSNRMSNSRGSKEGDESNSSIDTVPLFSSGRQSISGGGGEELRIPNGFIIDSSNPGSPTEQQQQKISPILGSGNRRTSTSGNYSIQNQRPNFPLSSHFSSSSNINLELGIQSNDNSNTRDRDRREGGGNELERTFSTDSQRQFVSKMKERYEFEKFNRVPLPTLPRNSSKFSMNNSNLNLLPINYSSSPRLLSIDSINQTDYFGNILNEERDRSERERETGARERALNREREDEEYFNSRR